MEEYTVGEFKANMSDIMNEAERTGKKVAILFGKNKKLKGYYVPHNPQGLKKRQIGILEGKATYEWIGDGKISLAEFLGEE